MKRSEDPAETARKIVAERFSAARAAWLGGSVVRGDSTPTSDLDITVLLPGPPAPLRDSIRYGGWPVELFVHTESSLAHYRRKDQDRRQPTIMRLVGESIILIDTDGSGVNLQCECLAEVAAGPRPLTADELASARYGVTDSLTDLEGGSDEAERAAISAVLWQEAARLLLAGSGRWTGVGKGLVRELRRYDLAESATYLPDLMDGFRRSIASDSDQLINICDRILDKFGGRRFEGHRLSGDAPSD
jgi:predicted nucleotidyltransferase